VGGISPHVYDLSQQLASFGHEIHVVTKATPLAADEEIEPSGVHVHRVPIKHEPVDFIHEIQLLNSATDLKVRALLEKWRPEGMPTVFHAHDWLSLDSARQLKYQYKLPIVATLHATEWGRHGGIFSDASRYISEQEYWLTYEAWRLIVCSEFMKSEAVRLFNCPSDKIDVIYNGVKAEKFQFEWSDESAQHMRVTYADPDEKIVLFVGRFVREKGIQVLLSAAHSVLAEYPKTRFVIAGSGGNREQFEQFVRWSGLGDRVTFAGFVGGTKLHQLYRCADCTVFPSLYEPFGIVALEAMASGVPVVTSDAGGLNEVVLHDQTGTTSYAGDSASLAWAIRKVFSDSERAIRLAETAKQRLSTDFAWPALAAQTSRVYERVWSEFMSSYWAEETVWPVSVGADQRYEERHLREQAEMAVQQGLVGRRSARVQLAGAYTEDETDRLREVIEP
jgi:glycosyltransferase involved in cell wall biosynthesis